MKFLSEIDEVMAERDLKKKDLAEKVGTSASYTTQIFRGNRIPSLQTIIKLADVLEIDFVISAKNK